MKTATATRELLSITVDGIELRGTCHKAQNRRSAPGPRSANNIGVLLLNPGVLPRTATGDSAVYWASCFADSGYPTFRFDLAGLGDSDGELPRDIMDYGTQVETGMYANQVSAVVNELCRRFQLSGIVIFGHCAGGISGLFAAASCKSIKGLIILDPYFDIREKVTKKRNVLSRWYQRAFREMEQNADQTRQSVQRASLALVNAAHALYQRLKYCRRLLQRNRLPANANLPLIRSWKMVSGAGTPIMVLRSGAQTVKVGEFDYYGYFQRSMRRQKDTMVQAIPETTHSFAEELGRDAVRMHSEKWLQRYFPLSSPTKSGTAADEPVYEAKL